MTVVIIRLVRMKDAPVMTKAVEAQAVFASGTEIHRNCCQPVAALR